MLRTLVLTLLTIESLALSAPVPTVAATARTATTRSRAEIKSLPIEQRPNRPGHFYGNTVRRRLHSGR